MMKIFTILLLSFSVLVNVACSSTAKDSKNVNATTDAATEQPGPISKKLDAATFKEKISEATEPQIIDVRTPREVELGTIENAQNINFYDDNFKDQVANLDRNKPVFVYCKAGSRSAQAAKVFENLGFKEIYDLKGGYNAWSRQ